MDLPEEQDLITSREAAEILGVCYVTVVRWRNRPKAKGPSFYRKMDRIFYKRSEVEAYAEKHTKMERVDIPE